MAVSRQQRWWILAVTVIVVAAVGFAIFFVTRTQAPEPPAVDRAEVLDNIPEAEFLWFSQPEEIKEEICGGLASAPDAYYELMKETWLEEAGLEPALFGALMTTIIDDCGL